MDALLLPLGLLAVGLVIARLGVLTWSSVQQAVHQRRQQRLSLQLLQQRIAETKRQQAFNAVAWNGYRKFVIARKTEEADGIYSYWLVPHDKKALPNFKPGQYLTFRLNVPGREKPVVRCYSLSDGPCSDHYRVSIKRVPPPRDVPSAPAGLVSSYFHEQLAEGDILDVQAPRGQFFLDPEAQRPAVLIAGGVGVTPLLSMAKSVAMAKSGREILFLYGVRNRRDHAFKEELEQLAEEHSNIRLVVCYSQPTKADEAGEGRDYHHDGRITIDLLKSYLQTTNYEFYLCGPPAMMQAMREQLAKWGVAKKDIHTEAFGPATISKAAKPAAAQQKQKQPADAGICHVSFSRTGKKCTWTADCENLLDFARANGVQIDSGCRAGNCGTCVVAVKSGKISYVTAHGAEVEEGACLTCIAVPDGDLELDA